MLDLSAVFDVDNHRLLMLQTEATKATVAPYNALVASRHCFFFFNGSLSDCCVWSPTEQLFRTTVIFTFHQWRATTEWNIVARQCTCGICHQNQIFIHENDFNEPLPTRMKLPFAPWCVVLDALTSGEPTSWWLRTMTTPSRTASPPGT